MSPRGIEQKIRRVEIFTIELRHDGIIRLYAEADHVVDMRLYKLMVETIGELTGGKKAPLLSTAGEFTIPNEEVRKYIQDPGSNPYASAVAMVAPSLSQKLLGASHVQTVLGKRPTRMFRTEEEAITWLKTFM